MPRTSLQQNLQLKLQLYIFGYYRDTNFAKTFGVRMFMKTQATIIDLKARNTYAYDASRRALRMRVGRAEQLSTLLGAKGTIPGLWRLSSTCFLLLNSLLFSFALLASTVD